MNLSDQIPKYEYIRLPIHLDLFNKNSILATASIEKE